MVRCAVALSNKLSRNRRLLACSPCSPETTTTAKQRQVPTVICWHKSHRMSSIPAGKGGFWGLRARHSKGGRRATSRGCSAPPFPHTANRCRHCEGLPCRNSGGPAKESLVLHPHKHGSRQTANLTLEDLLLSFNSFSQKRQTSMLDAAILSPFFTSKLARLPSGQTVKRSEEATALSILSPPSMVSDCQAHNSNDHAKRRTPAKDRVLT